MTRTLAIFAAIVSSASVARTQPQTVTYCKDLQQVIRLAASRERFASITTKPREGNFLDTSHRLTGWHDCSIYGSRNYSCDSADYKSADEARIALERTVQDIKTCLGSTWSEVKERSSPSYVVLHHATVAVSMTASTDERESGAHVVRLIVFVRNVEQQN